MKYFLPLLTIVLFASCEKIIFKKNMASGSPYDNFDCLWAEVDKKYSYFELKKIDWDQIRNEYRAMLNDNMTEEELFEVMAGMMNELKDDHVNLIAPFNFSRYNIPLKHKKNRHQRTVEEFYIPNAKYTGPFIHDFLKGTAVAYIRYGSFGNDVDEASLNHILTRYKDTRGIILDLRENGGGSIMNIPKLLGRFSSYRVLAGYSITRNGPGRNNFGPKEPFYIGTKKNITYLKPVAVLTDRGSYSATTMFALLTKVFPNITLIGDTTGGGGGLPNGGQLPNGWTYRFSVSQLLDLNGNNYAEQGVPPDIYAEFDWTDLTKDEIIERALLELQ